MEKYEVKKVVGQGSFGKAVLCKRKVDARLCIIKQISIKKMSRKEAILTEQEATLLKRLQHPNIVTFWESFVTSTNLYIVMEFADGGDLDHYIKAHAKKVPRKEIPEKQVLHMFVQLSLAIKHIHDRKILHRDLKSQNVFLTSSGQLKLGDFGVSRVLRHTVELAATQIGTPYYMSPEIMNNQRYNSKTDIWSLGCILYELMCLRLPFDGSSMKQLVNNIIKSNPASPPLAYSSELRELVRDTLCKNPKVRPGINSILSRPVMRTKISSLLGETTKQAEFSHTVLHGANVLNAPPISIRPPVSAAVPSSRPSSAAGAPAQPVASSAAQAVAMMQAQRQQQLLQQQQQFKLQQQKEQKQAQYVSAMAVQVKEQVEMARQAEAARVRVQQLQAEEQQRRLRLQAQDRARVEQARQIQQQAAADRAKHAAEALRAKEKQHNEQLEKLRRAALAEQQQKLERRRMERLEYEAQKQKQERERERELQKEKERIKEKARVKAAANGNNVAALLGKAGPAAIARRTPSASPVPSGAVPVRQFSAAALLAKRRHSAPEKPPPMRPPWVSVLDEPSPLGGRGPSPAPSNRGRTPSPGPSPRVRGPSPGPSPRVRGPSPGPSPRVRGPSPGPSPRVRTPSPAHAAASPAPVRIPPSGKNNGNAANNPFSDIVRGVGVGVAAARVDTASKESPGEQQQFQAKQAQSPLVKKSPYLRPPQCASPITPLSNAGSPAAEDVRRNYDAMPARKPLAVRPPVSSPVDAQSPGGKRDAAVNDAISKAQDVLQVVQGMHFRGGKAVPRNAAVSSSTDSSSSYGSILPSTPCPGTVQQSGNSNSSMRTSGTEQTTTANGDEEDAADSIAPRLPTPKQPHIHIDTSVSVAASNAGSAAASPWLSDLMGQMGQLKNQMQHLQQLRSPSVNATDDVDSPNSDPQSFEGDVSSGSSHVSSITAASPASFYRPPSSVPSVANTPRENAASGSGKHAQYAAQQQQRQKQPHQQLQERAKSDRQRMSFPLAESSAEIKRRQKAPAELVYGHQLEEEDEEDTKSNVSAAQDPLMHRKESRARHHADFRAFVRAQRQQRTGADDASPRSYSNGLEANSIASEASVGSAPPALRIRLPDKPQQGSSQSTQQSKGMQVSKSVSQLGVGKKGISPISTGGSSKPRTSGTQATGKSGKSNNPSPAQSPHSVLSSASSCASASPRNNAAAGFNVADFRSQREAQRLEMRQLMKERRQQLRKAEEQFSSDAVIVVSPVPPNYTAPPVEETPSSTIPTTRPEPPTTQRDTPQKTLSDYDDTERSRLFEHLQDQCGSSAVQEGLEELVGDATLSSVTMQDYNVLIEQMQAILREPSVRKHHHTRTLQHLIPKKASDEAAAAVLMTPEVQKDQVTAPGGLAITRRALASDLFLEDADVEEAVAIDTQVEPPVEGEEGEGNCNDGGSEDSDAFEEEELPVDLSGEGNDDEIVLEEGEEDQDDDGQDSLVDPQEEDDDGFGLVRDGEMEEGDGDMCEGDGEQAEDFEMLEFPDQNRADDPFLQPLVPAMMTADALLLMDPLRLANISAATPAGVITPIKGENNPNHPSHTGAGSSDVTADQSRRLQVAELQEYLVGKLGSGKVSQALHLLTVNTAATLTPGEDKHDGYYDERDEELLNRIEEILGTDSLHYLDDMFLLLTLQ